MYDSAFLDTAEGGSLDKVVALVGVTRLPAGHPVATLRVERDPTALGRITVAANTPVVDAAGNRYLTVSELTLEPGETARSVMVRGEATATAVVEAGALDRPEVVIAGVKRVGNAEPARPLGVAESDEQLRRRARAALHGTVRGTLDALRFAVQSVDGVQDVAITEFPNGVPGELQIVVAYRDDTPEVHREVDRVIKATRPAGVRVTSGVATPVRIDAQLELVLAGAVMPADAELDALTASAVDRVTAVLSGTPTGGLVRRAQLSAAVLADPGIVDATVTLAAPGQPGGSELQLPAGGVAQAGRVSVTRVHTESAADAALSVATADVLLPMHLVAGVTATQAQAAVTLAVDAYLSGIGPDVELTVDALLAAVRDDTRYAAVRTDAVVTVTTGGPGQERFRQLTDGVGGYTPATGEVIRRGQVDLDVREGQT